MRDYTKDQLHDMVRDLEHELHDTQRELTALRDRMSRLMQMLRHARPEAGLPASGAAQWMADVRYELNMQPNG